MVLAAAPLVLVGALAPTLPEDGRVARLAIEFPDAVPRPVQEEITSSVDEVLRKAGLSVVEVDRSCTDSECYQQVLSETDASLGAQVIIDAQGSDYTLTVSFFEPSGNVVVSDGESCEICRHDEVVSAAGQVVGRAADSFEIPKLLLATVSVVSSPSGANVRVDGELVGTTPYEAAVPGGSHAIRVEREGYESVERTIDTEGGKRYEESFELRAIETGKPNKGARAEVAVGATLLGLGLGAVAAGVALILIDENEIESDCSGENVDANGVCKWRYNTLVGGIAAAAAGGVSIATGIGLVVHGRKRAGKKPRAEVGFGLGSVRGRF